MAEFHDDNVVHLHFPSHVPSNEELAKRLATISASPKPTALVVELGIEPAKGQMRRIRRTIEKKLRKRAGLNLASLLTMTPTSSYETRHKDGKRVRRFPILYSNRSPVEELSKGIEKLLLGGASHKPQADVSIDDHFLRECLRHLNVDLHSPHLGYIFARAARAMRLRLVFPDARVPLRYLHYTIGDEKPNYDIAQCWQLNINPHDMNDFFSLLWETDIEEGPPLYVLFHECYINCDAAASIFAVLAIKALSLGLWPRETSTAAVWSTRRPDHCLLIMHFEAVSVTKPNDKEQPKIELEMPNGTWTPIEHYKGD